MMVPGGGGVVKLNLQWRLESYQNQKLMGKENVDVKLLIFIAFIVKYYKKYPYGYALIVAFIVYFNFVLHLRVFDMLVIDALALSVLV
jgi:hypothetical protein